MRTLYLLLGGLLLAQSALSHHSSLGLYDVDRIIEIEGVVTSVYWSNPHPRYTIVVSNAGADVEWNVEVGGAVSTLRQRGVSRDVVEVGDRIRIAGEASTRDLPELFAHNILLANGQEVLLGVRAQPRWEAGLTGNVFSSSPDELETKAARDHANGIFRVWSIDLSNRTSIMLYRMDSYPLTEAAEARRAQWDPRESPYIGCQSRGMPYLMHSAYPMEFVRQGQDVLLRMEIYDAVRVIHMNGEAPPDSTPHSPYGYSTGRWQGDALIVTTTLIDAPYFDGGDGTPQSRAIHLIEQFVPSETGDRLDYSLTVNDPETFTEELRFSKYYIWRPEISVEPFNCQD